MNLTKITKLRIKLVCILSAHQETPLEELAPEIRCLMECEEAIEDMWEQIEELEQEIEGLV
jgi:hypothetical protein